MSIQGKPKIYEISEPSQQTPEQSGLPPLLQSAYKFQSHVFPSDLGTSDNGHYVVFNINVQVNRGGGSIAGDTFSRYPGSLSLLATQRSKVDTLRLEQPRAAGGVAQSGAVLGSIANVTLANVGVSGQQAIFLERSTRRIAESIALHMPTPLIFNTHNVYEEISLTALGGKAIGIAAGSALRGVAGQLFQSFLGGASTGAKLLQRPINPMLEILFSTTAPRQFTFEVLMAPRNEQESVSMKNIIRSFRYHGAPEIQAATLGLTWIPPAEFDITFFNKGIENTHITRINTCVLERIEVDYAPTSGVYATFRNGHPVAVRMSLGFRELEPIHKERVIQGF